MILTSEGEVAVESLKVGDHVVTASGTARPIRWIGRRSFDIRRHAVPSSVMPVRILAGAFAGDLPRRDLVVSPGHSLFVDDSLIPVRFLVNGTTIVQDRSVDTVTYFHVELDSHDVLLAEGLPAESYLDTGNRRDFENAGRVVTLHPLFEAKDWADTCAPLLKSGPTVEAVKSRLIDRALEIGYSITEEHDLHIVADGQTIRPTWDGRRYSFSIPEGATTVRLDSKTWVPTQLVAGSQDDRKLGVCVASIEVNNAVVPLDTMLSGWHRFDISGSQSYRWTSGSAELPAQAREIAVELCGTARYWAAAPAAAEVPLKQAA